MPLVPRPEQSVASKTPLTEHVVVHRGARHAMPCHAVRAVCIQVARIAEISSIYAGRTIEFIERLVD